MIAPRLTFLLTAVRRHGFDSGLILGFSAAALLLLGGAAPGTLRAAESAPEVKDATPEHADDAKHPENSADGEAEKAPDVTDGATNSPVSEVSTTSTNTPSVKKDSKDSKEDSSGSNRRDRRRRDRDRSSGSGDGGASATTTTNAPNRGTDFAAFKIITDRNIFSPNRTTPSSRGETPREPKIENFSLVGTMSYDKGDFAFFDGSGSEYRKALKVADTIGGHKIVSITADEVVVEAGEKRLTLKMGSQLRRVDEGPWELRNSSVVAAAKATEAGSSAGSDSETGGSDDDVLKRLLKKREQEMNNEKR